MDWGNKVVTDVGGLQDRAVTLLALDSTGTPQWQLHGGSPDYDVAQGMDVLPEGICHIAVQTRDTFHFGPFTTDSGDLTLVVARIDPSLSTGIAAPEPVADQLTAFPSPFTTSFSVAGADVAGAVKVTVRDASVRVVAWGTSMQGLGYTLAPGAYIVEVAQDMRRWNARVVKQ